MRNLFAILRISFGVVVLLLLISSGLGLNTFLKQANSFHIDSDVTNSELLVTTITDQLNTILGSNMTNLL